MKLDRVALRILEILAQNCRTSHATIAKALKVSKDTVAYRIRLLEESQLLRQYMLFVDARLLGFTRYHILINFQSGHMPNVEQIHAMSNHPAVMWLNTFIGKFDLQIIVDAQDGFQLNSIREELFQLSRKQIKHYSVMTHLYDLEFTQLNPVLDLKTEFHKADPQSFGKAITRRRFPVAPEFSRISIDSVENKILRFLADDPRMSITEIAERANVERVTARKRIERLIRDKIIINFGAIPDLTQLGFITYYLLIRLNQGVPYKTLQRPFQRLRNIFYAGSMLGDYDMIAYLNARSPDELHGSILQFRRDLAEHIGTFDLLIQDRVHHWRQFTEGIYLQHRSLVRSVA